MSGTHVFVDESAKRDYLLVCVAITSDSVVTARKELKGLLLPGQRSLHMKDEREARRKKILSTICTLDVTALLLVASRHRFSGLSAARDECIRLAAQQAIGLGANRLVLDRNDSTQVRDRRIIADAARADGYPRPPFEYLHQARHEEPMLWVPDAVGWSWSRGGTWRAKVENLVTCRKV